MSGLFGSASNTATPDAASAPTIYAGLQVQTSANGVPITIVYGSTRISANLVWYGNFQAVPQYNTQTTQSAGKGGGGGNSAPAPTLTGYLYYADMIFGLCEGVIDNVPEMWIDQTIDTPAAEGITIGTGTIPQSVWSLLTLDAPSEAIPYSGVAVAMAQNYGLGSSASMPNNNFLVQRGAAFGSGTTNGLDADPALVVTDLLTNPNYGCGFASNTIGDIIQTSENRQIVGNTTTVIHAASFLRNLSVTLAGTLLTCVAASPGPNQYSFANGVYTFNAAQNTQSVAISYAYLDSLMTNYKNFCLSSGLWISPAYSTASPASAVLSDIANFTYSEFVWSAGILTLVPRGNSTVNGWVPNLTPLYDLTDDDFMENSNSSGGTSTSTDPVIMTRIRIADQDNTIQLEYLNRANQYAIDIAEVTDQAMADRYGRRFSGSQQAHLFADTAAAHTAAQLLLQKQYNRNTYSFQLDQRYTVLDPMDLVTITDATLGLDRQLVRIIEITENDDGSLSFMAEEMPNGTGAAAEYSFNSGNGFVPDYQVDPGNVNTPILFEAPVSLASSTGLEVWCAISGSNPAWAGAEIWTSADGNTYNLAGVQVGPARMGTLVASLPAGNDPDLTNVLSVDLTQSRGHLFSGTQNDADNFRTLCYVDGELISYETAILNSQYKYSLESYLRRGVGNSTNKAHAAGTQFARLDGAIFRIPFTVNQVGQTIFVKFLSYNIYGSGKQLISNVAEYQHVITGPPLPAKVQDFSISQGTNLPVTFTWTDLDDISVKGYDILFGPVGSPIETASELTLATRSTEMTNAAVPPGTWTFYIRARNIVDGLGPATSSQFTVTNVAGNIVNVEADPDWLPTPSTGTFVRHYTGILIPDSTKLASAHTKAELWEQFVPYPVANPSYTTTTLDYGFNASNSVFFQVVASLGRGATGTPSVTTSLDVYADGVSDPGTYTPWPTIASATGRYYKGKVTMNTSVHAYIKTMDMILTSPTKTVTINNFTVAIGGSTLTYTSQFHSAPNIQITVTSSGATGGSATSITSTSAFIQLFNGTTAVAGTCSITIIGG